RSGRQRESFKRLGILGDWEDPYLTMDYRYEADTVRELAKFMDNGSLYQGLKPVHWCTSCQTALAEAEVEYADHTSPSVYVRFVLEEGEAAKLGLKGEAAVVIWTTTPWTIPANRAVCVHPAFDYSAIAHKGGTLLMATELVGKVAPVIGVGEIEEIKRFKGSELEGIKTKHPLYGHISPVILGMHVTLDAGTGAVHTAPGHGQEDYAVGQKYGLEVFNPVRDNGLFKDDLPIFAGRRVPQVNPDVIEELNVRGMLLFTENINHSYPHCWRCKNPVIFRATAQWFIGMEHNGLRVKALAEINRVEWVPKWGKERIFGMVENRPDWCISRQRAWGVPITVLKCQKCDEPLIDGDTARRVADEMEQHGADIWFEKDAAHWAQGKTCKKCGASEWKKEEDILDVWFDSGVSQAAVLRRWKDLQWPGDMYLEGSDQHRGWFQSSLLASVGTAGSAPYGTVLTHGYVVDAKGRAMSKSVG
ncbi:MAG: isoleucine--tRNA ligase, partial [Candidatus Nitrosotenuis sp.]